jgi:hypothetical protein
MNAIKPARTPIWEKRKIDKRRNRLIRLILLFVIALVLVNLILKLPGIYQSLNSPFPRFPNDEGTTSELDTSFRTNYLLVSYKGSWLQDAAIASYEPVDKRLTLLLLELPKSKKLRLSTNKSFGSGGIDALSRQMSNQLGVILDRYLAFETAGVNFTAQDSLDAYKQLKSIGFFFNIFSIKNNMNKILKTNLTTGELINMLWKVRGAKFEEKDVASPTTLGVSNLQSEGAAEILKSLFFDRSIIDEGASVSIRNSSGVAGLGSRLAFYLDNLGASVVVVETGEEVTQDNFLAVRNEKLRTEKRIGSVFTYEKKDAIEEEFSGDILIILGEGSAEELTLP